MQTQRFSRGFDARSFIATGAHTTSQYPTLETRAGPKGIFTKGVSMKRSSFLNFEACIQQFQREILEIALMMDTPFVDMKTLTVFFFVIFGWVDGFSFRCVADIWQ